MQANVLAHSPLLTHSGLQFGGAPINSGRQEHAGDSPAALHSELGPQGEGWHGLICTGGGSSATNIKIRQGSLLCVSLLTNRCTSDEGVAYKFHSTTTYRVMVDNLAQSVNSTGAWTGVYALLILTGLIQGTLGTSDALWPTIWWTPKKTWYARAYSLFVYLSALTVWATRRWTTRVSYHRF